MSHTGSSVALCALPGDKTGEEGAGEVLPTECEADVIWSENDVADDDSVVVLVMRLSRLLWSTVAREEGLGGSCGAVVVEEEEAEEAEEEKVSSD